MTPPNQQSKQGVKRYARNSVTGDMIEFESGEWMSYFDYQSQTAELERYKKALRLYADESKWHRHVKEHPESVRQIFQTGLNGFYYAQAALKETKEE